MDECRLNSNWGFSLVTHPTFLLLLLHLLCTSIKLYPSLSPPRLYDQSQVNIHSPLHSVIDASTDVLRVWAFRRERMEKSTAPTKDAVPFLGADQPADYIPEHLVGAVATDSGAFHTDDTWPWTRDSTGVLDRNVAAEDGSEEVPWPPPLSTSIRTCSRCASGDVAEDRPKFRISSHNTRHPLRSSCTRMAIE